MGKIGLIVDGNINKIKKESELEAKIDDILGVLRGFNDPSPINFDAKIMSFERKKGD
jgi:hypothetical protein